MHTVPGRDTIDFSHDTTNVAFSSTDTNIFDSIDTDAIFDNAFLDASFSTLQTTSQVTGLNNMVNTAHGVYDFQEHAVVSTGWSPHLPDPAIARRFCVCLSGPRWILLTIFALV